MECTGLSDDMTDEEVEEYIRFCEFRVRLLLRMA